MYQYIVISARDFTSTIESRDISLSDSPMLRPISIFAITIRVSSAFGELRPFQGASVADIQFDSLNRIFDTRPLERRMETAKGL